MYPVIIYSAMPRFRPLLLGLVIGISMTLLYSRMQTKAQGVDAATVFSLQGELGQVPQDWFVPTVGYSARLVKEGVKPGQHSVLLTRDASVSDADKWRFGNIMRQFDAAPYRGKKVRFRATVRFEGAKPVDRAQLWLRVDRPDDQMGFFDNMDDRPIKDAAWKTYEIIGDIADDAVTINIGLILVDSGKVWMDDVTFEALGAVKATPVEGPRPITERGRDNLIAFTRLLGYVRHFYPGDEAANADWSQFAVAGVRRVEGAKDASDLARKLEDLFRPVAPAMQVYPTDQPPGVASAAGVAAGTGLRIVHWVHHGFGTGNPQSIYRSERVYRNVKPGEVPDGFPDPKTPYTADLGGGVSCRVPLSLYVDAQGTLPHAMAQGDLKADKPASLTGNDRATRLATVALAWNIFQHFYPYFDVVKTDWPQALRDGLTAAAEDKDERAFLDTLRRLVAALHDGHGYVGHSSDNGYAQPPVRLAWVGDSLVVAQPADKASDVLKAGDVILKIDKTPVAEAYAAAATRISAATEQWRRYRALSDLVRGPQGSSVKLEAKRGSGAPFTVTLLRELAKPPEERRPAPIAELKPGIWYVDLDGQRAKLKDFEAALPKLAQAKSIVFDMRGYPNEVAMRLLPHLARAPITSAFWNIPTVTYPDRQKLEFVTSRWGMIEPATPALTAKVAFVTDGRAISYAESIMGIVEHYKLGEIVGGPTAGTNGNVNPIRLPGDYSISWTGMKVIKHDDTQHHGIGILPTIPTAPTISGIAAGRDEVLEKAMEIISR